jgi:4-diphosphocytidyl-2-C-methyl-D-erythritol kinase
MGECRRFFCPAKLNLVLGVSGVGLDRYHNLTSLVVQVAFGDGIQLRFADDGIHDDFLSCDVPDIPTGPDNTIWRALMQFRQVYKFPQRLVIKLEKNIPYGSGLGGGSSDAALFLRNLNEMLARPLKEKELHILAAQIGADCPLFLSSSPCILRGKGDTVRSVDPSALHGLERMKFLIFKPDFPISTDWAYKQFDKKGLAAIVDSAITGFTIQSLLKDLQLQPRSHYFTNCFQAIACEKFMELGLILRDLEYYFHVQGYLTGTGSACYVPLPDTDDTTEMRSYLTDVLGPAPFIVETKPLIFADESF